MVTPQVKLPFRQSGTGESPEALVLSTTLNIFPIKKSRTGREKIAGTALGKNDF